MPSMTLAEGVYLLGPEPEAFAHTSNQGNVPHAFDLFRPGALKGAVLESACERELGHQGIELFAFPFGCSVLTAPSELVSFHSFVLTNLNGSNSFGYCVSWTSLAPRRYLGVVRMQLADVLLASDDFDEDFKQMPTALYLNHAIVIVSSVFHVSFFHRVLALAMSQLFPPLEVNDDPTFNFDHLSQQPMPFAPTEQHLQAAFSDFGRFALSRSSDIVLHRSLADCLFASLNDRSITLPPRSSIDHVADASESVYASSFAMRLVRTHRAISALCKSLLAPQLSRQIDVLTSRNSSRFVPHDHLPHQLLFSNLCPKSILVLITALLNEKSVLLISNRHDILAPCVVALHSLLYPLSWPFVYVPFLPTSLADFLDSPQPYLFGAPSSIRSLLPSSSSCAIADLDLNHVELHNLVLPSAQSMLHQSNSSISCSFWPCLHIDESNSDNPSAVATNSSGDVLQPLPSYFAWKIFSSLCRSSWLLFTEHNQIESVTRSASSLAHLQQQQSQYMSGNFKPSALFGQSNAPQASPSPPSRSAVVQPALPKHSSQSELRRVPSPPTRSAQFLRLPRCAHFPGCSEPAIASDARKLEMQRQCRLNDGPSHSFVQASRFGDLSSLTFANDNSAGTAASSLKRAALTLRTARSVLPFDPKNFFFNSSCALHLSPVGWPLILLRAMMVTASSDARLSLRRS